MSFKNCTACSINCFEDEDDDTHDSDKITNEGLLNLRLGRGFAVGRKGTVVNRWFNISYWVRTEKGGDCVDNNTGADRAVSDIKGWPFEGFVGKTEEIDNTLAGYPIDKVPDDPAHYKTYGKAALKMVGGEFPEVYDH